MTRMTENETKLLEQATAVVNAQLEKVEESFKPKYKELDWGKWKELNDALDAYKIEAKGVWIDELTDKFNNSAIAQIYKKEIYKNHEKWFTGEFNEQKYVEHRHNLTAKQIFLEAYNLIKDEDNWCQFTLKKETNAFEITPYQTEPKTVQQTKPRNQYCSIGAILKADGSKFIGRDNHMSVAASTVYRALERAMGQRIDRFNDSRSHAEVVAAWECCGKTEGWL